MPARSKCLLIRYRQSPGQETTRIRTLSGVNGTYRQEGTVLFRLLLGFKVVAKDVRLGRISYVTLNGTLGVCEDTP